MLKGKKILIVDNSRTIRLQIRMMLENEGAFLVDVDTILIAKDLGVRSYLKKPVKKIELISRIQEALKASN